jgi:hypothetical protein
VSLVRKGDIGEGTGINAIPNDQTTKQSNYNLQGVRVQQMQRGKIYIVNGKKVYVR